MDINHLFELGMKREIPQLIEPVMIEGNWRALNLGAGNQEYFGADALDLPDWDAETDAIPRPDNSVPAIFAFHFFEHFSGRDVIKILRECERVLVPGGTLNVLVPHRMSQMQWQDIDHKSVWCEETWRVLFSNPFYDKNREVPWRMKVNVNLIIGIVERNLSLMTQLVKIGAP